MIAPSIKVLVWRFKLHIIHLIQNWAYLEGLDLSTMQHHTTLALYKKKNRFSNFNIQPIFDCLKNIDEIVPVSILRKHMKQYAFAIKLQTLNYPINNAFYVDLSRWTHQKHTVMRISNANVQAEVTQMKQNFH